MACHWLCNGRTHRRRRLIHWSSLPRTDASPRAACNDRRERVGAKGADNTFAPIGADDKNELFQWEQTIYSAQYEPAIHLVQWEPTIHLVQWEPKFCWSNRSRRWERAGPMGADDTFGQIGADDENERHSPAHGEMHTKAPSSILGLRQSAQLALQYIV